MSRNKFQFESGVVTFGSAFVEHARVPLVFPDDGMTRQEFAEECDLNALMKRYERTGTLPQTAGRQPFYGDFSDLVSYQEAQNIMMAAEAAFMSLPARVRQEFDNDPARFVEFAEDESNVDQLRQWGLAKPLDRPEAVEASPADSAPQAASEPPGGPK